MVMQKGDFIKSVCFIGLTLFIAVGLLTIVGCGGGGGGGSESGEPGGGSESGEPGGGSESGESGGGSESGEPDGGSESGEPGGGSESGESGGGSESGESPGEPLPISLSSVLTAVTDDPNTIKLTNNSDGLDIEIWRRFLGIAEYIGEVQSGETLEDEVPYDGSTYFYYAYSTNYDPVRKLQGEIEVTSAIKPETHQRGPFYAWIDMCNWLGIPEDIFKIKTGAKIYSTVIHGVKLVMAFESEIRARLTEDQMKKYWDKACTIFHRHWSLYKGFPVDEYRIICCADCEVPDFGEGMIGHVVTRDFLLESIDCNNDSQCHELSHAIGHAWMGTTIGYESPREGWIHEGFDQFNGYIATSNRINFINGDRNAEIVLKHIDEPLISMYEKYFGTSDMYAYYGKGSLFAYLLSQKIVEEANMTYSGFMKHLYDKYFLSENSSQPQTYVNQLSINSERLWQDAEDYSGIDFDDLFQSYVYGNDIMPLINANDLYLPNWDY